MSADSELLAWEAFSSDALVSALTRSCHLSASFSYFFTLLSPLPIPSRPNLLMITWVLISMPVAFKASNSSYPDYIYSGSVPNLFANAGRPKSITYQGCRNLCGSGVQYYPWANSSQTIATWVLPVVSVLVQASYESNAFLKTIFALAGSAVLWLRFHTPYGTFI